MNENYEKYFCNPNGYLKMPLQQISLLLQRSGKFKITKAESKALSNTYQFIISISILCSRLKSYLDKYKKDSWVDVPLDELYLDTQCFILITQQYFEDLSFIIRLSFPDNEKAQLTPKFNKIIPRLLDILPKDTSLYDFLHKEVSWFEGFKDIRDDISHRTSFGRKRKYEFPQYHEIILSGGGKFHFADAKDLRSYIKLILTKTLSLSCLIDSYVTTKISQQNIDKYVKYVDESYILPNNAEIKEIVGEKNFRPGIMWLHMNKNSYDSLMYFLDKQA